MDSLYAGDLQIEVEQREGALLLHWIGMSGERQPEKFLRPYLKVAVDEALANGRTIELHFERIERFNSSTILCIIQMIQDARQRKARVDAIYDGTRKWQRLTFDALRIFAKPDGLFTLRAAGE
jgi:hypothetical protein